MSKTLNFNVALTFSDKITDDEAILEIAKNITRAIVNEANNGLGITPDYADAYTKEVVVKPQFLDDVVSETISM